MWKRSIPLFFALSLFVAPLTNQIDSPLSSISSSSSNNTTTATATSHPDEFKCSLNHIFKPNLYKKKPSTANKNTNTLYYYKTTHEGEYPNKVYGLFLCVFGISLGSCRNCWRDAIVIIKQHCHGAEEAILWYDQCLVRYSYRPFFSTLETVPNRCTTAASNADLYVGEPANFTRILYQTFLEMIQMATFDAFNKHAIKASNISGSNIILLYTIAQCIPNLSTQDCQVCLNIAVSIIPSCDFQGKKYGSILIPSCYISYELYQFHRFIRVRVRAPPPPTPTATAPSAHDDDEDRQLIRGGAPPPTPNSPSGHDNDVDGRLSRLTPAEAPTPTSLSAHDYDQDRRLIPGGSTPISPSAHDDDEVRRLIRGGAPPPTPNSLSAHGYDQERRLIPGGAPPSTPISPSAHDDDEVRRLIRGGAPPPTPTSPSAHDDVDDRPLIPAGAPPPPNSPSGHDNDVGGRLSRLTPAEAPPAPTFPSAHDDDEYGRLGRLTPAEAPPTPTSPSAHNDDGQLILVGAPPTPTSLSAHDYEKDRRLIPGGAPPSTPISPFAHDDDVVRRLIQVGAKPTPISPAHHGDNHQIFLAGAGVPNSSTGDKDIGAPTTSHNSKRRSNAWIIFLAIVIFLLLLLLITAYLLCRRRKVIPGNCQKFSFATVCKATQKFSIENHLGQGGFGSVYKGTLASGKRIAVKRLDRRSGQGRSQFWNEVDLIPGLRHKNIVQLLGYCEDEKTKEMMIIYEFIPNKSLDAHLFDSTNRPFVPLDWITRKNIAMGIARALAYLHEDSPLKIIHRDIKSSNVLLDDKMNPKISDFGMARLLEDNQSEANTTTIVGTYGYRAPEYCMEGVISSKLDVYSFGVVLLEIISGLKCLNHMDRSFSLPSHTWELWCKRSGIELMDKAMAQSSVNSDEVLRWIRIGLLCVQEDAGKRPYMSDVRRMLENRNIELLEPTSPPFCVGQPDLEASQQSSSIYLDAEVGLCQS